MVSLRALLAACLCVALFAAHLAAGVSLDERLGLVSPKFVRMFTVGSPCQATQASLGWFTSAAAKKPQQSKPNRVGVIFAYNPSPNDARLNGIQEWKEDVVGHFVEHFTRGASNSCLQHAQRKVDAAEGAANKEEEWTKEMPACAADGAFKRAAKGHLQACLADINAAFPKRNGKLPHGMQGLSDEFKLGGSKPSCALACGAAMLVDGRLKSCSIATVSDGATKTKMLSTSGSSGKPAFVPGDVVFPTSTLDSDTHPALETTMARWKNRAAWQSLAKAAARAGVAHAQQVPAPRSAPTPAHIQAAKQQDAAGLKKLADVFPPFAGQCSEDKILGAAHGTSAPQDEPAPSRKGGKKGSASKGGKKGSASKGGKKNKQKSKGGKRTKNPKSRGRR